MSNQTREARGVDKTVGNLLHAIPDAREYQERIEHLTDSISSEIHEWMATAKLQDARIRSINVNLELLADEIRRGSKVIDGWEQDIRAGASDLSLAFPRLGFRVIKDIPEGIA